MNKYYKIGLCLLISSIIYFVGFEAMQLYVQFVAFALIIIACSIVWVLDKINLAVFKKPREVFTMEEWLPKAIAALKKNSPESFRDGTHFEGEILQGVPAGIIYGYVVGLGHRKCAFGEIWKDAKNPIVSSFETLEFHLRSNFCKSKEEAAKIYLGLPKGGLEIFKKEEKLVKEVTT